MTCERGGEVNVLEDKIPASRTSRRVGFLVIHPTYMLRLRRTDQRRDRPSWCAVGIRECSAVELERRFKMSYGTGMILHMSRSGHVS